MAVQKAPVIKKTGSALRANFDFMVMSVRKLVQITVVIKVVTNRQVDVWIVLKENMEKIVHFLVQMAVMESLVIK